MSATAFQRKRRELREQTSVSARLNEDAVADGYAKTLDNYDEVRVQDQGVNHQAGDPPLNSTDGVVPEQLHDPSEDVGEKHQAGDPPPTSVTMREGEDAGYPQPDQFEYDNLAFREQATAGASVENAETGDNVKEDDPDDNDLEAMTVPKLKQRASDAGVEGASAMKKAELITAIRELEG